MFTPLCVLVDGMLGSEAKLFVKRSVDFDCKMGETLQHCDGTG